MKIELLLSEESLLLYVNELTNRTPNKHDRSQYLLAQVITTFNHDAEMQVVT